MAIYQSSPLSASSTATQNINGYLNSGLASLQTPAATANAANGISTTSGVAPSAFVNPNQVQLPNWMPTNPDQNLTELLQSYAGVNSAFDPSGQVTARNNSIAQNTASGNQAANNAAREYANRAAQSGGSSLGAGVVKAQSLLPVMSSNNQLRTQAADVAAEAHQKAASLSSQIATTLSQLRTSYLGTLSDFAAKQQGMAMQNNQFNSSLSLQNYSAQQNVANEAANRQLSYNQTQADLYKNAMSTSVQAQNNALAAANSVLAQKQAPSSSLTYTNGAYGHNATYSQYPQMANLGAYQNSALSALAGMF